jgi:hypothetical protein
MEGTLAVPLSGSRHCRSHCTVGGRHDAWMKRVKRRRVWLQSTSLNMLEMKRGRPCPLLPYFDRGCDILTSLDEIHCHKIDIRERDVLASGMVLPHAFAVIEGRLRCLLVVNVPGDAGIQNTCELVELALPRYISVHAARSPILHYPWRGV